MQSGSPRPLYTTWWSTLWLTNIQRMLKLWRRPCPSLWPTRRHNHSVLEWIHRLPQISQNCHPSLGILNVMALMRHFTAQHVDHTLDDFEMFRMNLVVLSLARWWLDKLIFRRQVVNIYYSIFKHSTSSHGVYSINWVSTLPFVSPYLNSVIIDHIKWRYFFSCYKTFSLATPALDGWHEPHHVSWAFPSSFHSWPHFLFSDPNPTF